MLENNKRFWLEKFDCFSLSGKDAKKFLNGITTANIINSNNQVCKTCWLTPNGVLRALIEIVFFEQELNLVILEGNKSEIRNYFNKIIFPADDVHLNEPFLINRFQEADELNSWKCCQPIFFKNDDQPYEKYKNEANIMNNDDLKSWKIKQAIPSFNNEIDGKNNPLELGLADLIDFNKGCYLGQETISKIKNVATLKQEIRVWNCLDYLPNLESEDQNIYLDLGKEISVGKVTSFHKSYSHVQGLAMIKRKYLGKCKSFYSEIFGQIEISKSSSSIFL